MRLICGFAFLIVCICSSAFAEEKFTVIKLSTNDGELTTQIQTHLQKAEQLKQKTFVQLVAEWCGPCRHLRASMGDKKMQDAFRGTYIVQLDSDEWKEQLPSIGITLKAIPVFYQLDANGMATNYKIDGGAWGEDTPDNMAPPLKKYFSRAH